MGFIAKLFGGKNPKAPQAPPPAPNIGDAAGEAAARQNRSRLNRRRGIEDSLLGGNLGTIGQGTKIDRPAPKTLLG